MTSDRSNGPGGDAPNAGANTPDALSAIVRAHATRPPYNAVDWDGFAARITSAAAPELDRRRKAARWSDSRRDRFRVRAWWEITAGWARPALAAAVATIAVAGTLVLATWGATSALSADGATVTASADGVDSVMLDSQTGIATADASSAIQDSLFSAIVNVR
jgi:hypothetical protein